MAGRGFAPKPAHLRARTNKVAGAAKLQSPAAASGNEVPALPDREDGEVWHPMVREWWDSVWRSPMASEYLDADMRGGLYVLADLYQIRWTVSSKTMLIEAVKEIRLQEPRFGLTPLDRRRLQWEVERGEEAATRTESRRAPRAAPKSGKDPRDVLKAVS